VTVSSSSVHADHPDTPWLTVRDVLWLVAFVIVAAVLRFGTLGLQSFWDDEGYTVGLMRKSFTDLVAGVWATESAPPLYYVLAWLWTHALGIDEPGVRSLSALAGTALVPASYAATLPFAGRRAGLVASAVVAVNPFLVWYSQEARTYALFALLIAVAFACFGFALGTAARRTETHLLWAWSIMAALSLSTHYFALFVVAPEAVFLLRRFGIRRLVGQLAVLTTTCFALLPVAIHQQGKSFGFADEPIMRRVLQIPQQFLVGYGVWSEPLGKLAAGVATACILVAAVLAVRHLGSLNAPSLAVVACVGGFAVAVPIALAATGRDYVLTLYFVGALVPAVVFVASGWALTRAGLVAASVYIAVSVGVNVAVATTPRFQREDIRGVAEAIPDLCRDRAIVISPSTVLTAYIPNLRVMPSSGARVREITVAAMATKEAGQREQVPRRLRKSLSAPGFRLAERIDGRRFTVVRFLSSSPRWVTPSLLIESRIGPWPAERVTVFWERCSSAQPSS
jgi:mannosyltransferase